MRGMAVVIAAVLLVTSATLPARADWVAVVEPYLRIQAALAADGIEGANAAAEEIVREATALGTRATAVVDAARAVSRATDLKTARKAFALLSTALIDAAGDELGPKIRVAYCPMASSSWLQTGNTIRNPYYGSEMPTCGVFKK